MVALLFTACGAQFADDCGADFAGDSGLLKMNQEESAQGCGSDFAGEIGVVDFAADAVSPDSGGCFELLAVRMGRPARGFFTG